MVDVLLLSISVLKVLNVGLLAEGSMAGAVIGLAG